MESSNIITSDMAASPEAHLEKTCHFFRLPAELRDHIYELVVKEDHPLQAGFTKHCTFLKNPRDGGLPVQQ
jgi:hypothetical protein